MSGDVRVMFVANVNGELVHEEKGIDGSVGAVYKSTGPIIKSVRRFHIDNVIDSRSLAAGLRENAKKFIQSLDSVHQTTDVIFACQPETKIERNENTRRLRVQTTFSMRVLKKQ